MRVTVAATGISTEEFPEPEVANTMLVRAVWMRELRKAPWLSSSALAAARDSVTMMDAGPVPEEGDTEAQEGNVLDCTDHLVPAGTTCRGGDGRVPTTQNSICSQWRRV